MWDAETDEQRIKRPRKKRGGRVAGEHPRPRGDRRTRGGKLTTATRNAIPGKDFALPDRRYPIEDESHARNALARVSQQGDSAEKAKVRSKVRAKYPDIKQGE